MVLTLFTSGHVAAPGEIPLAHEDLGAGQRVSGVTLVRDDSAVDQVWVRRALPAVGDLRQLGARVVPLHLCSCWTGGGWRQRHSEDTQESSDVTDVYPARKQAAAAVD